MSYRFVQGIDYGPAKGRLGWNLHMSEGTDGLVTYLARKSGETLAQWKTRVRGVSCNFAILSTGEVIQMVAWDRSAGNLNPHDRSTDKAFYGRRFLLEVLGDHWTDPNAYTLSCEMAGFRSKGPTRAQVEALVKLVAESRERYPQMVGAFGHADQTDTKGCPGTAPTMLEIWTRIGHGKFGTAEEAEMYPIVTRTTPALLPVPAGKWIYTNQDFTPDKDNAQTSADRDYFYIGRFRNRDNVVGQAISYTTPGGDQRMRFVKEADAGDAKPYPLPEPIDCTPEVKKAVESFRVKAMDAVRGVPA